MIYCKPQDRSLDAITILSSMGQAG